MDRQTDRQVERQIDRKTDSDIMTAGCQKQVKYRVNHDWGRGNVKGPGKTGGCLVEMAIKAGLTVLSKLYISINRLQISI